MLNVHTSEFINSQSKHISLKKKTKYRNLAIIAVFSILTTYLIYLQYQTHYLKNKLLSISNLNQWCELELLSLKKMHNSDLKSKYSVSPLISSKIVNSFFNYEFLVNWFPHQYSKDLDFTSIYNSRSDGDDFTSFHQRVDNYTNLLFLFSTTNGMKFGAFTRYKVNYDKDIYAKFDDELIVFSLTNQMKYWLDKNERRVSVRRGYWITFGNNLISISENCLGNTESVSEFGDSDRLTGAKHFAIKDFEIYVVGNIYQRK